MRYSEVTGRLGKRRTLLVLEFFITNQIFMTVQKRRSRRSVHQCTDFVRGNEMLISIGNYKVLKQLITPFNLRECHLKIFQFLCD